MYIVKTVVDRLNSSKKSKLEKWEINENNNIN